MVMLNWKTLPMPVVGYHVYRSLSPEGPFERANKDILPKAAHNDRGLENATPYYYRITALDFMGGESAQGEPIMLTPRDMTPPDAVIGVNGVFASESMTVTLTWEAPEATDTVGYTVLRKEYIPIPLVDENADINELSPRVRQAIQEALEREAQNQPVTITTEMVSSPTFVDSTVENGMNYLYFVKAMDMAGNISATSVQTLIRIPDTIPPATPVGLRGQPTDNRSILIEWDPNTEKDIFGYYLLRSGTPDLAIQELVAPEVILAGTHSYEDTHVDSAATYFYVIKAVDWVSNESVLSQPVELIAPNYEPPSIPVALFTLGGDGVINLSWAPNQEMDIAAYRIYTADSASGTFEQLGDDVASETLTFAHAPVESGVAHWYKISAVDTANNESAQSAPVEGMAVDREPPAPPATPVCAFGSPGSPDEKSVTVTWTPNPEKDIAGYAVYRAAISRSGVVDRISGADLIPRDALTFTDDKLTPGVNYWYVIRAFDTSGNRSRESEPAGPFIIEAK
jgi:fibronectin type 3 domain-containing protein